MKYEVLVEGEYGEGDELANHKVGETIELGDTDVSAAVEEGKLRPVDEAKASEAAGEEKTAETQTGGDEAAPGGDNSGAGAEA